ncbi:hypothetical protein [cyanobacterium endosymbiont of Epithemia clementina EcSB]|uniref:hypothetical protein n=1 Tax=cyanobacterium endosymbiont of Epithemia clementina EcSB TaxID=3034674 RepID=UPI00247FC305|nr:hypothetical protein [cyanobacterium endosymbiont of Epithemia clementina EcSB]WGT67450.1 hypothetical protein P3F56_09715 [cyanobacterium endosymbiont of Epithemia clementina EcSB]
MNSGKIVAIITGTVSIFLAIAYLILVQLLDIRGETIPGSNFNNKQISIHEVVNNKINNCEVLNAKGIIV